MFAIYLATTVIDSTITIFVDGNAGVIMKTFIVLGLRALDYSA
jgi:hypothetical protein